MIDVRKELTCLSKNIKVNLYDNNSVDLPISTKVDRVLFEGKIVDRKRIILLTVGCGVGTCTMCPFPNESNKNITDLNLITQFNHALNESENNVELITIFNNGNFFRDKEISKEVRIHIYKEISKIPGIKYLCVESLPQFITEEKIAEAKQYLGDIKLTVYIGFQSSNDYIREVAINTTCTKNNFEKAVNLLFKNNYGVNVFVMVKPPFLTEWEAFNDSLKTIKYLTSLGIYYSILCPTRVASNTVLEQLYNKGLYTPPNIWTIVNLLLINNDAGISRPMVNTTELKQELNLDSVCTISEKDEAKEIIEAIEKFLFTRNPIELLGLRYKFIDSYKKYFREINKEKDNKKPIKDRILEFLEK